MQARAYRPRIVPLSHGEISFLPSPPPSPPDLHGFYSWVVIARWDSTLVVSRVVIARGEAALIGMEDRWYLRPYKWLRPDVVSPAAYLVCPPDQTPANSGVLVQPALIDVQFRKVWMPFFRREGRDPVTPEAFLDFVGCLFGAN